jgi:hypothetical protein
MTRASRRLCRASVKLTHHARCLGKAIDLKAVKAETITKAALLDPKAIRKLNSFRPKSRVNMEVVVKRLGMKEIAKQVSHQNYTLHCNFWKCITFTLGYLNQQNILKHETHALFVTLFKDWLVLTPKDRLPKPEVEFFPRPAKCTDGSYIYDRIPPSAQALKAMASGSGEGRYAGPQSQLFKKRQYQEKQAANDPPAKIQRTGGTPEPGTFYCGISISFCRTSPLKDLDTKISPPSNKESVRYFYL